jgi:hypothetical protein
MAVRPRRRRRSCRAQRGTQELLSPARGRLGDVLISWGAWREQRQDRRGLICRVSPACFVGRVESRRGPAARRPEDLALAGWRRLLVSRDRRAKKGPFVARLGHVLHLGRRRSVLRAPAGSVDLDGHPTRGGSCFDQFNCCVRTGVGEQPLGGAVSRNSDPHLHRGRTTPQPALGSTMPWS